ncbi:MAG: hypothetical protein HC902_09495 [Calothrix sp. SM1_5_4]|nr:hypothetical protein [Calothrix sp. SM1_5_4]
MRFPWGGFFSLRPDLDATLELSLEELEGESAFFRETRLLTWAPWRPHFEIRIGQQFLPVGLLNERDNWFSSNPPYMDRLFAGSKGVDLGVAADFDPLGGRHLYLQASMFAGRLIRSEDAMAGGPELAPRVLSVKSHSEYHDLFLTYFTHDLAFYDPVRAYGLGFELRSADWSGWRGRVLSEAWRIRQSQALGPDELSHGYLVYSELVWRGLTLGARWSELQAKLLKSQSLPPSRSRLYLAEVELTRGLSLRVERVCEIQSEIQRDEWVGRVLFHWPNRVGSGL